MQEQDSLPGPHPHRGIFVSLVVAIILLLAVFGFFVYSAFFMPTEEPAEETTDQATIDRMQDEMDDMIVKLEDYQNQEPTTSTFSQFPETLPSFAYPVSWNAAVTDSRMGTSLRRVVHVSPTPIHFCDACDGPRSPIVISSVDKTVGLGAHATLEAYVNANNSGPMYTNVVISKIADEQFSVTGHVQGLYEEDYELSYFTTNKTLITVYYSVPNPADADVSAAWEVIENSLMFRFIE